LKEKIEKWKKLEEEARKIRRSEADWNFIESQPPKIRAALKFYVETGDIRLASRIADMSIEEFRRLLRSARIPVVV
jgi:PaREP6 domain containing protein